MQSQPLESLSERLLRGGVAYRHVRRYIRELHDHYEDALREELAKGSDRSLAEQAAWARLGDGEDLVRSVLAQPALRSTAARFPGLMFGAAPVFIWIASLALMLFAFAVLDETYEAAPPSWIIGSNYALSLLCVRVLPVILGVLLLIVSARQRTALYWPIVGTAIVALLGGTITVNLTLAATPQASQFSMHSELLSMIFPSPTVFGMPNALALAGGLARAALMVGIAATTYVIWRMQQSRSSRPA